jgi:predicted GNAT family N-acyltransferase
MSVIIRGIRNFAEIERLYAYYPKVFVKTPLTFFKSRIDNDPFLIPEDIRIAEEEDKIISSAVVLRRKMYWNNKVKSFAGIGNVSTLPPKRGNNLAATVMKDALQYSENINTDTAILFTGINRFYEKLNFFTISSNHIIFRIEEPARKDYIIRSFTKADLTFISEIYESFNRYLYGPLVREVKYWDANLSFADPNEIFLVAERFNSIEGYMRIVPETLRNEIWEFGYTKREALDALLCEAGRILGKKIFKSASLCPYNMLTDTQHVKIEYEAASLAMAYIHDTASELKNEFNNYCFWWTDNF